jgi:di/tricarboxylate transporter
MEIQPQQIALLGILLAAVILFFTEWIRIDLTALVIIIVLSATRILEPQEALSGFSSEPAIMLASIFVLSSALFHTGLSARLGDWIGWLAGSGRRRITAVIMVSVALLSAFTHHVTLTAIMLPVVLRLSRENNISPAKLLMPMSFAASLGTTIMIIGAPAFLIANGLLRQAGQEGLHIFSILPIGLALTFAGTLFMLLFGRFLLPDHPMQEETKERFRLVGYYTELVYYTGAAHIGRTIKQIEAFEEQDFKVVNWLRDGKTRRRPYGSKKVKEGDVLLVRTTPEKIATIRKEPGIALNPMARFADEATLSQTNHKSQASIVQAVVAPSSDLIGNSIAQIGFLQRYGVIVVGIWRQRGWLQTELAKIKLREGDVLVVVGDAHSFQRLADDRSFLMLVPFMGEPKPRHKAPIAGMIMVASVLAAALHLLSVEIALLAGAVAVVFTGCITLRQAYQAIDRRIYVFIAGAIPLGLALQQTGTAQLLAGWFGHLAANWSSFALLMTLFLCSGLLTQVMSDAATTALLAPVALALARLLGAPPEPFVIVVAMASVVSFFTPIGHHGNMLILGPGGYRFRDFLVAGTPLTLLAALIVVILAPLLWP